MHELDCGCGSHLEGSDEQSLTIKVFFHLEAAHPEIEEPTMELAEDLVAAKAYDRSSSSAGALVGTHHLEGAKQNPREG
jgi:hypothetical protein